MSTNLYWLILLIAVFGEIGWALSLKFIQTNPGPWPIASAVVLTVFNMVLLSWAMRGLPVGTAYAVWTGLGAVGITIFGIVLFGDSAAPARLAFIGLIVAGVAGLKLTGQ
jgi:quaternary ammonium compound-resistance protein SugE